MPKIFALWPPGSPSEEIQEIFWWREKDRQALSNFKTNIYEMAMKHWQWYQTTTEYPINHFFLIPDNSRSNHEFQANDKNEFYRHTLLRKKELYQGVFYLPEPNQDYLELSLKMRQDTATESYKLWPSAWYVRDLHSQQFIQAGQVKNQEFYRGYIHPNQGIAFWTDPRDAENDIYDLFDKAHDYQIELMQSDFVFGGIQYI